MRLIKIIISSFLLFTLAFSCKDEPKQPEVNQNQLVGRWEISQAWRNGRPTETLTGTYYEFRNDGIMKTNLTASGMEEEAPYKVDGMEIEQDSKPEKVIYSVLELSDSVLSMSMQIQNFPFRLRLVKNNPSMETPVDTL